MKIIQIAVTSGGTDNETDLLYALTDKGKVYRINPVDHFQKWQEIKPLTPPNIHQEF